MASRPAAARANLELMSVAGRIVRELPQDLLRRRTAQPLHEARGFLRMCRFLQRCRVVDQRLRMIRFAANGQARVLVLLKTAGAAQVDLLGQAQVGQMKRRGLNFVGRRCV